MRVELGYFCTGLSLGIGGFKSGWVGGWVRVGGWGSCCMSIYKIPIITRTNSYGGGHRISERGGGGGPGNC